jgi:hypothetical protein
MLEDKKHALLDFNFVVDNAVRGKVYDPYGKLMKGVCLNLIPAEDKNSSLYKADCTEESGAYEIDEIPPGNYILAINTGGKISSSEPFKTFYYPDVSDPDKAAVLTIAAGQSLNDIEIHVPRVEETITIEGRFLYANGKPVADEYVQFKAENAGADIDDEAQALTDADGRFSIKILKGLKGKLYGAMYTYIGEFENCPKLEAAIKKSGQDNAELQTPALVIKAENDLYDVELRYPFPGCKKKESEP